MPSILIRSKTKVVAEDCGLTINACHHIIVGAPSPKEYRMPNASLPKNVDVLLESNNLQLVFHGSLNGKPISPSRVSCSALIKILLDYLRLNRSVLGLEHISDVRVLEETDLPTAVLSTSSRQTLTSPGSSGHVTLSKIAISFDWHIPAFNQDMEDNGDKNPFSASLLLPYQLVLDAALMKFINWQIVKRYPFIFGPWCQQFEMEATHFLGLYQSIQSIIRRSPNDAFRRKCGELFARLKANHMTSDDIINTSLSDYLESVQLHSNDDPVFQKEPLKTTSSKGAFFHALQKVYRNQMRRPHFKGLKKAPKADDTDDESLSHSHYQVPHTSSEDAACVEAESSEGFQDHSSKLSLFDHHFVFNSPPRSRVSSPAGSPPVRTDFLENDMFWSDSDSSDFNFSFSPCVAQDSRPTSPMDELWLEEPPSGSRPSNRHYPVSDMDSGSENNDRPLELDDSEWHFDYPNSLNFDDECSHVDDQMGLGHENEVESKLGMESKPQDIHCINNWLEFSVTGSTSMLTDVNPVEKCHLMTYSEDNGPYRNLACLEAGICNRQTNDSEFIGSPTLEDVDILSDTGSVSSMVRGSGSRNGVGPNQLSGGLVGIDGTNSHKFATLSITRPPESTASSQLRLWDGPEGEARFWSWDENALVDSSLQVDELPLCMDF